MAVGVVAVMNLGVCQTLPMKRNQMQRLASMPGHQLRRVRGVLTDIDDTLTTQGAITADALEALQRLRDHGLPVYAITGRSMGWSQPFVRQWPLDAIVAENGAVAMHLEGDEVVTLYAQDAATRTAGAVRLQQVAAQLLREVPGARLAQDSAGRVTDIALDHGEFHQMGPAQIDAAVRLMHAAGMQASVSSIHINGWFGTHDKLSGARWIVQQRLGIDHDVERDRWLFVGDSTNDQRMFGHFPLSVGVANLLHFADQLTVWPAYLTATARGAGFAEVADLLLSARA